MSISNLVAIEKTNGVYLALYRWTETVTSIYGHPVYTNIPNMTGKIRPSRHLRNTKQASKVVKRGQTSELSEDEAKALYDAAKATSMIASIEQRENGNWVVWIK